MGVAKKDESSGAAISVTSQDIQIYQFVSDAVEMRRSLCNLSKKYPIYLYKTLAIFGRIKTVLESSL